MFQGSISSRQLWISQTFVEKRTGNCENYITVQQDDETNVRKRLNCKSWEKICFSHDVAHPVNQHRNGNSPFEDVFPSFQCLVSLPEGIFFYQSIRTASSRGCVSEKSVCFKNQDSTHMTIGWKKTQNDLINCHYFHLRRSLGPL